MKNILLSFAALVAMAAPSLAQGTPLSGLQPGDTIRVWATGPRLNGETGQFDARLRDTLRFTTLLSRTTDVPYVTLRRVDVKRGMHRSVGRILVGTVLGATVGAFVGAGLGVAVECGGNCGDDGDYEGLAGFVLGGGTGIIAGGVAGGIIAGRKRTPRWDAVDLRR